MSIDRVQSACARHVCARRCTHLGFGASLLHAQHLLLDVELFVAWGGNDRASCCTLPALDYTVAAAACRKLLLMAGIGGNSVSRCEFKRGTRWKRFEMSIAAAIERERLTTSTALVAFVARLPLRGQGGRWRVAAWLL